MWFQVHYPPLVGVLPTFRSRYLCAIGHQRVLSLARWTSQIQTHFHVSGPTQVPDRTASPFAYGTFTPYGPPFQRVRLGQLLMTPVLQPHPDESGWFGLFRFRSPLLTESLLLSFPRGTEMFQFPPFATWCYGFTPS